MRARKSQLLISVAIALSGVGVAIRSFSEFRPFLHDDALISLRYARNLLSGHGLVWNEFERVEGYTNFLHTIAVAGLGGLGMDLVSAARGLGLASYLALVVFVAGYLRRLSRKEQHDVALLSGSFALIVGSAPLIAWSLGGLETLTFTLLCTVAIWIYADARPCSPRRASAVGLCFALAAMCRPDAVLLLGVTGATSVVAALRNPREWRSALVMAGSFVLLYAPYFVWRVAYYGDFLPNAFYVKAGVGAASWEFGGHYLARFLLAPPFALVIAMVATLWVAGLGRLEARSRYLLTIVAAQFGWILYAGGDHMPAFRFIVPVIPSIVLLAHLGLQQALDKRGILLRNGVATMLAAACIAQLIWLPPDLMRARRTDAAAFVGRIVGEHIEQSFPPDSTVALHTAGSTPYYAPSLNFIDMLGLNDRHIAHRDVGERRVPWQGVPGHGKGDGAYVLRRQPDYIILGSASGTVATLPTFLSDYELARLPEFADRYSLVVERLSVEDEPGHELYHATRRGTLKFRYYERVGLRGE